MKVKILCTMNKYDEAKEIMQDLTKWHPDNQAEVEERMKQIEEEAKSQVENEKEVYKNMFAQP